MTTTERRDALLDLVLLRCPLEDAIEAIKRFPWDSDVEVVTLTREDAVRVLRTFETGTLSASDCAAWANAIEGRDDIGLEENADEALKDFLFEVGTPEISRQLTRSTAEEWRRRLG